MYCICCKKNNIKPSPIADNESKMTEEEFLWSSDSKELDENGRKYYGKSVLVTNVNNRLWDGGVVQIIDAGYGSSHDTDQFIIGICDDCISKELETGNLLFYNNYMSPGMVKDDIEKSKSKFRRNKNLDDLV